MSTLPPELDDLIADHLRDAKRALITCALVNRSWLRSSRHRLFAKVALADKNSDTFLELAAHPLATFLTCIRSLTSTHSKFFTGLLPRLPIFPSLEDLHLHCNDGNGVSEDILTQLGVVFPHVTELDVLNSIGFYRVRDLLIVVSRFPHIQQLSINANFLREDTPISHLPPVPPSLEVVRVHSGPGSDDPFDHVTAWLAPAQEPRAIRSLEVGILKRQSLTSVGNLVRALGPELHALSLNLMYHVTTADVETHLDLSRNINLQDLTVHVGLRRYNPPSTTRSYAPWAILAAPQSSFIKSLTIVLRIDLVYMLDSFDWARLNTMLGSSTHFSELRRLNFLVHCPSDEFVGAIRARVPVWDEKGIVRVQVMRSGRVFRP